MSRILVVESQGSFGNAAKDSLGQDGHEVLVAYSIAEARELLGDGQHFDAVISALFFKDDPACSEEDRELMMEAIQLARTRWTGQQTHLEAYGDWIPRGLRVLTYCWYKNIPVIILVDDHGDSNSLTILEGALPKLLDEGANIEYPKDLNILKSPWCLQVAYKTSIEDWRKTLANCSGTIAVIWFLPKAKNSFRNCLD